MHSRRRQAQPAGILDAVGRRSDDLLDSADAIITVAFDDAHRQPVSGNTPAHKNNHPVNLTDTVAEIVHRANGDRITLIFHKHRIFRHKSSVELAQQVYATSIAYRITKIKFSPKRIVFLLALFPFL